MTLYLLLLEAHEFIGNVEMPTISLSFIIKIIVYGKPTLIASLPSVNILTSSHFCQHLLIRSYPARLASLVKIVFLLLVD